MKKTEIKLDDITRIKQFALNEFHRSSNLSRFETKEMQVYLILQGLTTYLTSKGIEVPFTLEQEKVEDSLPIDEDGLIS